MNTLCLSCQWHQVNPLQKLTDRHTWGDLYRDIDIVFASLEKTPYARIAIHSTTHYEYTVGLLALLYARKTPIVFMDDVASYQTMKGEYEAVLSFEEDLPIDAPQIRVSVDNVTHIVSRPLKALEATQIITLYTSGSTGKPTCVEKSLAALDTEAKLLLPSMTWRDRVIATTVDPHHLYGLSFVIWAGLATHTPIHEKRLRFTEDVDALHDPLILVTTPTFMRLTPDTPTPALIALMLSAGGQLTEPIVEHVRNWTSASIMDVYGSTETGAIATRMHEGSDYATAWRLVPEAKLECTDHGWRLYSPILDTPFFELSDNLQIHDNGTFTLLGRQDRIAKIGEVRLSLTRIENVLREEFGWDTKAMVVRRGERDAIGVVINVESAPGFTPANVQRYKAQLRPFLEPLAIPRYWRSIPSWPYNPQGKIEMPRLLALFDDHE